MSAAALDPTIILVEDMIMKGDTGIPIRLKKYFFKATKVTQSDWVVTATYFPGTYLKGHATTIDSSGDGADETLTYVSSGTKLTLGSANTGTVYGEVIVQVA